MSAFGGKADIELNRYDVADYAVLCRRGLKGPLSRLKPNQKIGRPHFQNVRLKLDPLWIAKRLIQLSLG
jgi:hypothetical protein